MRHTPIVISMVADELYENRENRESIESFPLAQIPCMLYSNLYVAYQLCTLESS